MADRILQNIDESRRGFVKRLLGTAFAAPVIATFSIEALMTTTANAVEASNQTVVCNQTDSDLFREFFFDGAAGEECRVVPTVQL